jgi:hypothetical protein
MRGASRGGNNSNDQAPSQHNGVKQRLISSRYWSVRTDSLAHDPDLCANGQRVFEICKELQLRRLPTADA